MADKTPAQKEIERLEKAARRERWVQQFVRDCKAIGLPEPLYGTRELVFHPTRMWRFDVAWPAYKTAVEIDGGVYAKGRHTRGAGYEEDCRKLAEAYLLGWTVFRFSTGMVKNGEAVAFIERALLERVRRVESLRSA